MILKKVIALVAASYSLVGMTSADESLSLENRLKEFNQPTVVIERVVSSKPKPVVKAKPQKVSTRTSTTKRRHLRGPCYEFPADVLRQKANAYQPHIRTNSAKYGVDEALIISVITAESCFRQRARSPKHAQGLMQLIPATAKRFGVVDAYEPSQNIRGGTRYLRFLVKRFSGNLEHAVAAYNAGEGAVDRYSGIPPYRETKEYVRRVLGVYYRLKGVTRVPTQTGRVKATYAVSQPSKTRGNFIKPDYKWRQQSSTRAAAIARQRQQQLRRVAAPATKARVCRDTSSAKIRNSSDLIKRTKLWRRFYTVKQPMTLSTISRQTGVGLNHLLTLNRGISRLKVKLGREVLIWQCSNN